MGEQQEVQGSNNQDGGSQPAASESPAEEVKAGDKTPAGSTAEQPKTEGKREPGVPPPSYFVKKRQEERQSKEVAQTIESLKREIAELKEQRQANLSQDEYPEAPAPSQPATKGVQSADELRSIIRQEQAALLREQTQIQRESEANKWLSSQKHVEDPKFADGVRKYLNHLQEQEQAMGFKSDPVYLAKKAYDDVADYFGVGGSPALDEGTSDAQARASAPAPSGGTQVGGSEANKQVSAQEITDKMVQAFRDKDGARYKELEAQRDKALREGRLIP